jgi:UDP-glucose 4-epimerase
MNKILVTGGFGFIGSYITEELLRNKYEVIVADISDEHAVVGAKYINCDILSHNDLNKVFNEDFDTIIHLAGFSNLRESVNNPTLTLSLNTLATTTILELAVKKGVKKFIYGSSAYANSNKGSFYGISKLASEKIIEEFNQNFNLDYLILRYGSVYSDRESHNNYMYNLIANALNKGTINHHSNGLELREYIHAQDVARLTVQVIKNKEYINESFILTGIEQYTRLQLFQMIKEISGKNIIINMSKEDDKNQYKLSPYSFQPSRARKLIANPQIDLGQGLLDIIRKINSYEIKANL